MGAVRAEEPEMKVLLALTCLLAFLALALSESASHRDVELLGDQLGVRDKREAARGDNRSLKKNGLRKKKRANKNKSKKVKKARTKGANKKKGKKAIENNAKREKGKRTRKTKERRKSSKKKRGNKKKFLG